MEIFLNIFYYNKKTDFHFKKSVEFLIGALGRNRPDSESGSALGGNESNNVPPERIELPPPGSKPGILSIKL